MKVVSMTHEMFATGEKYRNTQKMPAIFATDHATHTVLQELNPAAAWVFTEEATPTHKRDGVGVLVTEELDIMVRRQVKKGKAAPEGFLLAETDPNTGHMFGVEPLAQSGRGKLVKEFLDAGAVLSPGTYELVGPRINGNPERLDAHEMIRHGEPIDFPDMRTFAHLTGAELWAELLPLFEGYRDAGIEGVVFWGAGGKRAKLRVKDFFGDPHRR